jgi:hypothetical protein
MGDKKPKKTSSGNSDAHKAKLAKDQLERPPIPSRDEKEKGKRK